VKSKWLDWAPGSEIMGKAPDLTPTKPTEPSFVGFEGGAPDRSRVIRDSETSPIPAHPSRQAEFQGGIKAALPVDLYADRLGAAMQSLARPEYPAGMIPWLGEAHPALYAELTARLPDEIQRLWEAHASIDDFQSVIDLWIEAYRTGCEMYQRELAKGTAADHPTKSDCGRTETRRIDA